VHPETFEVDPGGFGGRTEYVSLQIAIVERPATLAEKDVLVFLSLIRSSIFQEFTRQRSDLPYSPARFGLRS